jgi:DNA-binding MarR family transcriptional regulator
MQNNQTLSSLHLWHDITCASLLELPYDLSARQMALLTTVYLTKGPHTVRSLSEALSVSKPAICRAIDTLSMMDLIKRKKDEDDKRNVFIQRTVNGSVFLSDMADIITRESAGSWMHNAQEQRKTAFT